ncbi:MAG: tubulin-like doman-containing protein, partial [Pirellula sp.]
MCIGLGGFGGRTLAEIRKCENLNNHYFVEQDRVPPNLKFLYFDSSMDIHLDRARWMFRGEDLSLPPADIVNMRDGTVPLNLANVGNVARYNQWIGTDETRNRHLLAAGVGVVGANQRRRFGRLIFAANIERFSSAVHNKLRTNHEAQCSFHIFATFGGGTGSGSVVDAVTAIRRLQPDNQKFPIYVYGYITDQCDGFDVGFFRLNQYSVIRDLNGLMTGRYQPQLLQSMERADRNTSYVDNVFLIGPINGQDHNLRPDDQVKAVGNWVYQKILCDDIGAIPADERKAFTGEDMMQVFPGESDGGEHLVRSCRFGAIGLKRWHIPEEETHDALMLDSIVEVLKQNIGNQWDQEIGYMPVGEVPIPVARMLDAMGLSNEEQWTASEYPDESSFNDEWNSSDQNVGLSNSLGDSVTRLYRILNEHRNSGFRAAGLNAYFRARQLGIKLEADRIKQLLINFLDFNWEEGSSGLNGQIASLDILRQDLFMKIDAFREKREAYGRVAKLDEVHNASMERAGAAGPIAVLFGAETGMFASMKQQMITACVYETYEKGYAYAIELCTALCALIVNVRDGLNATKNILKQLSTTVEHQRAEKLVFEGGRGGDIVEFEQRDYDFIWGIMKIDRDYIDRVSR